MLQVGSNIYHYPVCYSNRSEELLTQPEISVQRGFEKAKVKMFGKFQNINFNRWILNILQDQIFLLIMKWINPYTSTVFQSFYLVQFVLIFRQSQSWLSSNPIARFLHKENFADSLNVHKTDSLCKNKACYYVHRKYVGPRQT